MNKVSVSMPESARSSVIQRIVVGKQIYTVPCRQHGYAEFVGKLDEFVGSACGSDAIAGKKYGSFGTIDELDRFKDGVV